MNADADEKAHEKEEERGNKPGKGAKRNANDKKEKEDLIADWL